MQSPLVNPSTPISTPTKTPEIEICRYLTWSSIIESDLIILPFRRDIESSTSVNHSTPILFHALNKLSSKRPPRVNFHSIEDIVYGGETKPVNISQSSYENESGYSSFNSSNNMTPSFQKHSESSSMENVSDSEEVNDKENKKSDGSKKARTTFTDDQKRSLDVYFQKNPYPDPRETEELSRELSLPENVIKVWFQNKRSRDKQRKFSNRSRVPVQFNENNKNLPVSSPLVANLQLLSSRFSTYLAAANNYHNSFQNY